MEDLTGKVDSTPGPTGQLAATEWNPFVQEFKNLINAMGLTLDVGDLNQVTKSVGYLSLLARHMTCGGVANAYTLAAIAPRPAPLGYADGMQLQFRPNVANTGATTVNVSGLGARSVVREDLSALQAGDISGSRDAIIRFDSGGNRFLLLNAALGAPAQALPVGYITGLTMTNAAADPTHDVTVEVGQCRDVANSANIVLSSVITKRFDATLGEGTAQGGYPLTTLGARSADAWYRFFVVMNVDGTVDAGWDTNANASALLTDFNTIRSGWNYYRQIGWTKTKFGSTTDFIPFQNSPSDPDVFQWVEHDTYPVEDLNPLPVVRTAVSLHGQCPPGAVAVCDAFLTDRSGSGTVDHFLLLTNKNAADFTPSSTAYTLRTRTTPGATGQATQMMGTAHVEVDASSEVYARFDATGSFDFWLSVPRFIFKR